MLIAFLWGNARLTLPPAPACVSMQCVHFFFIFSRMFGCIIPKRPCGDNKHSDKRVNILLSIKHKIDILKYKALVVALHERIMEKYLRMN